MIVCMQLRRTVQLTQGIALWSMAAWSGRKQWTHETKHFEIMKTKFLASSLLLLSPLPLAGRMQRQALRAAPWHHFPGLWGKCICREVWGPPAELPGLPWQLEEVQLLRFPLLNSIQILWKNPAHSCSPAQTASPVLPLSRPLLSFACSLPLCSMAVSSFNEGSKNMWLHQSSSLHVLSVHLVFVCCMCT